MNIDTINSLYRHGLRRLPPIGTVLSLSRLGTHILEGELVDIEGYLKLPEGGYEYFLIVLSPERGQMRTKLYKYDRIQVQFLPPNCPPVRKWERYEY